MEILLLLKQSLPPSCWRYFSGIIARLRMHLCFGFFIDAAYNSLLRRRSAPGGAPAQHGRYFIDSSRIAFGDARTALLCRPSGILEAMMRADSAARCG